MEIVNDFTIRVATVNGSGSQSSNSVLMKALFHMGIPVSGKNIFPSNIAGLPTWYHIRLSKEGYISHRLEAEILVLLNADTFDEDLRTAKPSSVVIYEEKLAQNKTLREDLIYYAIPFQHIVNECCEVARLRKLVVNMVYVGAVAELLGIEEARLQATLEKQFHNKPKAVDLNWRAVKAGAEYVKKNITKKDPYRVKSMDKTGGKIIITGNEAAGLGCLFGGCSVFTWYPITPASSLGDAVVDYFGRFRRNNKNHEANFAVVQAEDELAAIGMAIGAGWAGARAATSTSGPGISLMAEFAGLAYFTEIPVVIFNVQRLGPSTGLPTRTSQGDVLFTHFLSHGDTTHLALIPATPEECFEFSMEAFNLAEEFQTLVFVLSDLDLGMNNWMSDPFQYPTAPFRRGKVLSAEKVRALKEFHRYADPDGDGVSYRTLPGMKEPKAAYFTRGSGHTKAATYSERPEDWTEILDKLKRKMETAKLKLPKPSVEKTKGAKVGLMAYGTTHHALAEARDLLAQKGLKTNYLRIASLPLNGDVGNFLNECDRVYCVEQNQQGQMGNLLAMQYPMSAPKIQKILFYDGMPIDARVLTNKIFEKESL